MDAKVSRWLSFSTKLLQARVVSNKAKSKQFIEELNLRRELISEINQNQLMLSNRSIEGVYQVVGANSEHAEQGYFGVLTLKYEDHRIFATWLIEGEDEQTGFGLFINNVLSLNFEYKQENQFFAGLVSYEFLSDKVITGVWVEEGTDEVGVEFGRKLPIETIDPLKYFGFN